jgi:hypothetical protein
VQLQFANQRAEFFGVDVSGHATLRKGADRDVTTLTASLAYVHGQNLSDGGPLYHQMPLDIKVGWNTGRALEAGVDLNGSPPRTASMPRATNHARPPMRWSTCAWPTRSDRCG